MKPVLMKLMAILWALLPHFLIVIAEMFLTFFIIDKFNSAMDFLSNDISKALILVWCILSFVNAAVLISRR